ncbi:MAG: hypothetical protein IPI83_11925 [Sphingomonadales bacterium]|nr:hypothetical protein [Sphingomonadales bacterium]
MRDKLIDWGRATNAIRRTVTVGDLLPVGTGAMATASNTLPAVESVKCRQATALGLRLANGTLLAATRQAGTYGHG